MRLKCTCTAANSLRVCEVEGGVKEEGWEERSERKGWVEG